MSEDDEPVAAAALQAKKKPRKTYKPGQVVSSTFRMKTKAEVKAGVCQGCFKNSADEAEWTLCADPSQSTKNVCSPCQNRRDPEAAQTRAGGRTGRGRCSAAGLLSGEHKSGAKHRHTAKYKGFEWTGRCCNQTCADAVAKALYQHEHEGVPYPEGFRPPPPTSAPSAAAANQ